MTGLTLRPATRNDLEALTALLAGLSAESSYQRFQTALGACPSPATVAALLPDGIRGRALLGFVGEELVAHGMWVRVRTSRVAEIAILVADGHQRRRIGSHLADALIADLAARGIDRVEVYTGSSNRAVPRMVARSAPDADRARDGGSVSYTFAVDRRRASFTGMPTAVSSGPRRPSAA